MTGPGWLGPGLGTSNPGLRRVHRCRGINGVTTSDERGKKTLEWSQHDDLASFVRMRDILEQA